MGLPGSRTARPIWIAALGHDLDLVVTLDDATGAICSALLVEQEGTMSSFLGLAETITRHGQFGALYTDRFTSCSWKCFTVKSL
jgi:hypothetical protein